MKFPLTLFTFIPTSIPNSLMLELFMFTWIIFICGFIFTLVTFISHSFMLWLFMFSKITLKCCFVFTFITFISNSFMFYVYLPLSYLTLICGFHTGHIHISLLHALTLYDWLGNSARQLYTHISHIHI